MQRLRISWLGLFTLACLLGAGIFLALQLIQYSRSFDQLPSGLSLGGVPVGGLTETEARQQVVSVYNSDVELRYRDAVIVLKPAAVNFDVNVDAMLPQVANLRGNDTFWVGLWDYLWLRPAIARDVELNATYSQASLRRILEDIASRYDQPGAAPEPDPENLGFKAGASGQALNIDPAIDLIDAAMRSPRAEDRVVNLPLVEQTQVNPSFGTLHDLLIDDTQLWGFSGVVSLYLADLQTGDELAFTLSGADIITGPVAFSAMSTIKIPVALAYYLKSDTAPTEGIQLLLQRSLDESQNRDTDQLLRLIGDGDGYTGTRQMVDMLRTLGLDNTYLSGLLDVQGAVLSPILTPGNSREDLNLNPDPYNQTTAVDMGSLTVMIYQCSHAKGPLLLAFNGKITPTECQQLLQMMTENAVGPIFISSGSGGAVVAHKHGWDSSPLTNAGDTALVFTPNGDYALTVFLHQPESILFDDANRIIGRLAQAVYNFYEQKQK